MVNENLHVFCDRMIAQGVIEDQDVRALWRDVLPDGFGHQDEADLLIALDRAVPAAGPGWAEGLTIAVVDFAVWQVRPTGRIDAGTARWLADSLGCGIGPTVTGGRIAFEVVRAAHEVDESFLVFALDANRRLRDAAEVLAQSMAA